MGFKCLPTERLTKEERKLFVIPLHELTQDIIDKKKEANKKVKEIEKYWGFSGSGIGSWFKRTFYKLFVHRFVRKS